jgi:quercetin dioxygenase-like cupin family protein
MSHTTPTVARDAFALPPRDAIIVPPGRGDAHRAFGSRIEFKLGGAETGGALTLGLATTPPGAGPPVHRHLAEDELLIVIAGRIELTLGGAWTPVPPGSVVFVPRGVAHAFRNVGDTPSQHWLLTTPSGFELFYRACADLFEDAAAGGTGPDVARLRALFAEYRMERVREGEWRNGV